MALEKLAFKSFPQGVSPAPLPQDPSGQILSSKSLVLSTRRKRQIVMNTELVERQWLPWHCKAIEKLGPDTYLDLADIARDGREPETLFVWLIKQELNLGNQ